MSQIQQKIPEFRCQEHLVYDGEHYDLVYDPGNPQRAQVIPNYEAMFPQQTSVIQECELPGLGQRWMAIVDAVTPAQSMQQTGGLPTVEKRYLCFRIYKHEYELPREEIQKKPDGTLVTVRSPLAARPQEMVIYARSTSGNTQGNRAQRLIAALLGAAMKDMPVTDMNWTQQLAEAQVRKAGGQDTNIAIPNQPVNVSVEQDDEQD